MKQLLDTNICIPLINGAEPTLAAKLLAQRPDNVVLCSVVVAELYHGACNSAWVAENLDRVRRFCQAFQSLPFDDTAAERYGSIRVQLQHEGRLIGGNDLLIAATTLANDVTLITRNTSEFSRVPGLRVEAW